MLELDTPQMTTWRMRIAVWVHKATHTHTEYVILIVFLIQQWLQESASMLRYTYITFLVLCLEGVPIVALL